LERRRYLRQDAALVARVCDALPEIGFVMSLGSISDVTDGLEEVYEFAEMIQNTGKPVIGWCFSKDHCKDIHHIAAAIAGGEDELRYRPIYIFYNEPISPLTCDFNAVDKLIYCAEHGIPQIFAPANSGGATVPATHAAHLMVTLAESLIGVVISQIVCPGACIIIGGTQSILDMRTMVFSYGAPELSIMSAGLSELAEYIGLPVFTAGGCSDANTLELQSGIEATLSLHSAMLSGANLVHDIGFIESGMTGSVYQLVMADEIIAMARKIARGVLVTEETLAVEEIKKYGLAGDYSGTEHTNKWSQDHWSPRIMDRQSPDNWENNGSKDMKQRLHEYTMNIINEHQGSLEKVPQKVRREIENILQSAEQKKLQEKSN
jgi:trimethylamine--corrinoid protein Co-methyltransferase